MNRQFGAHSATLQKPWYTLTATSSQRNLKPIRWIQEKNLRKNSKAMFMPTKHVHIIHAVDKQMIGCSASALNHKVTCTVLCLLLVDTCVRLRIAVIDCCLVHLNVLEFPTTMRNRCDYNCVERNLHVHKTV